MAFKEYKVLHIVEGGLGTIFLGASGIPINEDGNSSQQRSGRWLDTSFSSSRAKALFTALETRSCNYYVWSLNKHVLTGRGLC